METATAQPQGAVLEYKGVLSGGHQGWVTSISTPSDPTVNTIISASRDKKVMIWQLYDEEINGKSGISKLALKGHNQTVQDVFMSSDGLFALSGSWDKTLRLWDLVRGETVRSFTGHKSDVNSVAFSPDNRQIVSGSRDKTIKLWNTLADCRQTIVDQQHTDWISCVRFSPSANEPTIVSGGWDKKVKVWDLSTCKLKRDLLGHQGVVYSVTVSPDGSLCASGGRDGVAMLWDVFKGKHLYSLESGYTINALCFSPCNYWLCAATDRSIKVWDLENKNVLAELVPERQQKIGLPWCVSLSWSADGRTLFAGSTNGNIYVYQVGLNYSYLTT